MNWSKAIAKEVGAQEANETYVWGFPPKGKRLLPTRWVFKAKVNDRGEVVRYKARIVAKGFV